MTEEKPFEFSVESRAYFFSKTRSAGPDWDRDCPDALTQSRYQYLNQHLAVAAAGSVIAFSLKKKKSKGPGFPAELAGSTCGAEGDSVEAKRRRGWRRLKVSRVTWRPGRLWQRRPRPPLALRSLRGAPGSRWTVRQQGSTILWAGSSGGMARRS
ncbi:hypothetical protein AMECASPLE_023036 [Ameca splendens]|uniref:Uncharacterized protein n=1 Tax=Ameca splendens TaxID=208324 RepID=A0ABV0XT10_9TELE